MSDPTSGCIDGADITQTTQTAQVIVFGTVSGTASTTFDFILFVLILIFFSLAFIAEGTDVPLVKVSQTRNEIPATMSTLNGDYYFFFPFFST